MNTHRLLSFIIMLLSVNLAYSQTSDLSKEDMDQLLEQTKHKVNEFNGYVSFIAKKKRYKSLQEQNEMEQSKTEYIKQALKLFIGGGYAYIDEDGNHQPASVMQVSSISKKTRKTKVTDRDISIYLNNLRNLRYTEVNVTAGDAFFCSDAKQVGPNKYMATLSYRQYFVGKMDGRIVYNDKTDKTVKVYITKTVIDGRTRWTVLLGDIKVDATEP